MVIRGLKVFGLCIGAALVCAFAFVAMLRFSLPPSDGGYGLSTTELLSDPFVFFGALYGGAVCGVLSFPFAYLGTLHRRLFTSGLFVFAVVITEIMLVTPFAGGVVWWARYPRSVSVFWSVSTQAGNGLPKPVGVHKTEGEGEGGDITRPLLPTK